MTSDILTEVEAFLVRHNMPHSRFGRLALNDEKFVTYLRGGRQPQQDTICRVRRWMDGHEDRGLTRGTSAQLCEGREIGRTISFSLEKPVLLLNQTKRMHHQAIARYQRSLAWEIKVTAGSSIPPQPFEAARVTITRYSRGVPDMDGLAGGCKEVLDCLTTPVTTPGKNGRAHVRNPRGLGFIRDDSARYCFFQPVSCVCRVHEERTDILIEEMILPEVAPEPRAVTAARNPA